MKGSLFKKRELLVKINPMEKKNCPVRRICLTPPFNLTVAVQPPKVLVSDIKREVKALMCVYLSSTRKAERVKGGRRNGTKQPSGTCCIGLGRGCPGSPSLGRGRGMVM